MLKRRNVNLEPESPLTESNKQVYNQIYVYIMYGSLSSIPPSLCLHGMSTSVNLFTLWSLSCYFNCCLFSPLSLSLSHHTGSPGPVHFLHS